MSYDGITPLDDAIAFDLKLCKRRDPDKLSKLKKQACGALGIEFVKQGGKIWSVQIRRQRRFCRQSRK